MYSEVNKIIKGFCRVNILKCTLDTVKRVIIIKCALLKVSDTYKRYNITKISFTYNYGKNKCKQLNEQKPKTLGDSYILIKILANSHYHKFKDAQQNTQGAMKKL